MSFLNCILSVQKIQVLETLCPKNTNFSMRNENVWSELFILVFEALNFRGFLGHAETRGIDSEENKDISLIFMQF